MAIGKHKTIEVVAGPNGSGKTSFAKAYLLGKEGRIVYLNPDVIASGIVPLDFEKASFHAGRVLISEIKAMILRGESFAFESTLSGKTWFRMLGGHPIPSEAVHRRHPRCFSNFWKMYRPICDDWYLLDNSGKKPKSVQNKTSFEKSSSESQKQFMETFLLGELP